MDRLPGHAERLGNPCETPSFPYGPLYLRGLQAVSEAAQRHDSGQAVTRSPRDWEIVLHAVNYS